jgi:ABC-type branched-subunit amino acid transport system permease subunit
VDRQSRIHGVRLGGSRTPIAIVAVALVLAFVPSLGLPAFYDSLLYLILHWMVLATSWNILSGYTGYFSFGHGAFFGAGLYTSATLMARWNWSFLWTLPAAAAVACVLGVALGAIVFRVKGIRGEVFALLTLAVTFVVGTIIVNRLQVTWITPTSESATIFPDTEVRSPYAGRLRPIKDFTGSRS